MPDYSSKEIETILTESGITTTPVRLLVYKALLSSASPLSLSDLETALESVDKSSISRTLNIFRNHRLIHSFNDGSGSVKYEICYSYDDDRHVHFRCEKCGETICLNHIMIPHVNLPNGYISLEINYVIKGICNKCSRTVN